jgi:hypothetical protein
MFTALVLACLGADTPVTVSASATRYQTGGGARLAVGHRPAFTAVAEVGAWRAPFLEVRVQARDEPWPRQWSLRYWPDGVLTVDYGAGTLNCRPCRPAVWWPTGPQP